MWTSQTWSASTSGALDLGFEPRPITLPTYTGSTSSGYAKMTHEPHIPVAKFHSFAAAACFLTCCCGDQLLYFGKNEAWIFFSDSLDLQRAFLELSYTKLYYQRKLGSNLPSYRQIELWDLTLMKGGEVVTIHHKRIRQWRVVLCNNTSQKNKRQWRVVPCNNTSQKHKRLCREVVRTKLVRKGSGGDSGKWWRREVVRKGSGDFGKWWLGGLVT